MPRDGAITMTKAKSERMDQSPPDAALLQLLGYVTLAWSTVDEMLTAALFSLLSIDKFEFTILIGKIEFPTKLAKLDQILSHRKDKPRLKFVQKLKTEMDNLRGDRNALTHGVYQGKSDRGEFFFMVPLDIIFDKVMTIRLTNCVYLHIEQSATMWKRLWLSERILPSILMRPNG
jgi:hypothetical protein